MFWRGKNKFNHLEMVGARRLIGFGAVGGGVGSPMGNTFYVDNGATNMGDDNEGKDPTYPLETVDAALGLCANDNDDYIYVLDCWDADTYPISIDKSLCHIIGLGNPTTWRWATLTGGGTADVIRLAANYIELAGFSIISAGYDGIHFYANNGYHWLHHLNFAIAAASVVNAIEFDSAYGTNSLIEDCAFGKVAANITGTGILGQGVEVTIRNNVFKNCTTLCINLSSSGGGYVYNNLFSIEDDVNGEAITLQSGAANYMVAGNIAMNGMLSGGYTYTPYRDLAANTANDWGMNYVGNRVVEPVGV